MNDSVNDVFSDELITDLQTEWAVLDVIRTLDPMMWDRAISEMLAEYTDIRRAGRWQRGAYDFFGVLRISRSELHHCSMIAWLLDPEGRHGLGRAFLDRLIARYIPDVDPSKLRVRSVDTEVQRLETRADIIVWGDTATLIIEAKVDAGEGWQQCDRLFERFSEEQGSQFVFLTPSGRSPLTATGPSGEAFVSLSFHELADCLEAAIESVGHSTGLGSGMARNYLFTLRTVFS